MKIVLTGGGTGGHACPAASIAEALRAEMPDCGLLYVGSRGGPEAKLAAEAGIPFSGLTTRSLGRLFSLGMIPTAAAFGKGFMEALSILRRFEPELVIGTGGYAAAPVVLAQVLRGGRTVIHEQNTVPGRTNRWLGRFASAICVTFEDSMRYFPPGKTVVTGLPIRSQILNAPGKAEARSALGLDPDTFTILVLGGSQGARRVNQAVAEALQALSRLPVQVFHQAGERNFREAEEGAKALAWDGYHLCAYVDDMGLAYGAADLAVSRCGASTIAEITAVGLPAILVPYPYAYADHQRLNAEFVSRNGAGIIVSDSELTGGILTDTIGRLLNSPEEIRKMGEASRKLGRPNAARDVVAVALGKSDA